MTRTTSDILNELFDYLGDDRWELAEMIIDLSEGAGFANPHTKRLLSELMLSMPEPDNLTIQDIANHIQAIGTEFAGQVAHDILVINRELD